MAVLNNPFLEQLNVFRAYKGGCTCLYGGYVWEFCPGHHLQNKWGWVAQHRIVAEDKLGRPLRQSRDPQIGEHVHHIDGRRENNDPQNLEVMTKSRHHSHETKKYFEQRYGYITHDAVTAALQGRTIREAAAILGVTHMTIRRRCPSAIAHRKRRPPTSSDNPPASALAAIRRYALDPGKGVQDAAVDLHMAERTILKICEKHQIEWTRKSKVGMLHRTYRGKPTLRALALRALGIDPETTRRRSRHAKPAELPRHDAEAKPA